MTKFKITYIILFTMFAFPVFAQYDNCPSCQQMQQQGQDWARQQEMEAQQQQMRQQAEDQQRQIQQQQQQIDYNQSHFPSACCWPR